MDDLKVLEEELAKFYSREQVAVEDFVSVKQRALSLGCNVPSQVAILPRNFSNAECTDQLFHEPSVLIVRDLLRSAGLHETPLENNGQSFPSLVVKSEGIWLGPIILFTYAYLSQNPQAITIALNVISNYLTDLFKGRGCPGYVSLDVVVEKPDGSTTKVHYQGPESGFLKFAGSIDTLLRRRKS